jgi:hypothetical protein
MTTMRKAFANLLAVMQAQVYAKIGTLAVAFLAAIAWAMWMGGTTASKTFAQAKVIAMMRPVTDSIKARQDKQDTVTNAIRDSLGETRREVRDVQRVQEMIVSALRQSNPKFDQALQEMARYGEDQKRWEEDNRDLIRKIKNRNTQ